MITACGRPVSRRDEIYEIVARISRFEGCKGIIRVAADDGYLRLLGRGAAKVKYRAPVTLSRLVTAMRRKERILTPDEALATALMLKGMGATTVTLLSSRIWRAERASWNARTLKWTVTMAIEDLLSAAWEDEDVLLYPLEDGMISFEGTVKGEGMTMDSSILSSWCKHERHLSGGR